MRLRPGDRALLDVTIRNADKRLGSHRPSAWWTFLTKQLAPPGVSGCRVFPLSFGSQGCRMITLAEFVRADGVCT